MRANRTEPAYFDNSKPDYGINRKFQIGRSDGYSKFDNDVAVSKNKFIFNTDTDERVFDNSVVAHMQVSNKQPVIGKPSEVSMFDNSVVKDKQFIILNTDKTTRWFDNSANVFNGSTKPSIPITGPSTSPAWFDNNNSGAFDFAMGTASKGVFDIFSNISRLSDELYGYDQIVADLDYPELGYNWFDNSVPSYKVVGQSKLIPWGFGKTDYQFSYRFPAYIWTAAGTDLDDDDELLTYQWWLSRKVDGVWVQLSSGTELEFTYPFQYEGDYKLVLRTTDIEGAWDEKIEEFPILFGDCDSSGAAGSGCEGVIRLESNRFEMVSMPVRGRTVADYFMAKVAEVTGKPAEESIEFAKAYPSNDISSGKYIGFVPGVTNAEGLYNFKLVETDNGVEAHVPFLVRTKEIAEPIIIEWSTVDEM